MKSLTELANIHKTDKGTTHLGGHGYSHTYSEYLEGSRDKDIVLLEIGVLYGNSLRMWLDYFSKGFVYGIDTFPTNRFHEKYISYGIPKGVKFQEYLQKEGVKTAGEYYCQQIQNTLPEDRCKLSFCSQGYIENNNFNIQAGFDVDRKLENFVGLEEFMKVHNYPKFDVIVDDASHKQEDHQISFGYLFDHLKPNGLYFIEDLKTGKHHKALVNHYGMEAPLTESLFKKFLETGKLNSNYINSEIASRLESDIAQCNFHNQDNLVVLRKQS